MMKSRLVLLLACLGLLLVSVSSPAEMIVRSKDGRTFRVPLRCDEVESIEFTAERTATAPIPGRGKEFTDYKGRKVFLPCGELAFAGNVAAFNIGRPASTPSASNPGEALGPNNYSEERDSGYVTLGCGGSIVLEFTRVYLVDKSGPDLYVFEIGPAVEPTRLEISLDGRNWIEIGRISGGKASVDIHGHVNPGDKFRFVRLTDLKTACDGKWPGADIDAVAAIGCVMAR